MNDYLTAAQMKELLVEASPGPLRHVTIERSDDTDPDTGKPFWRVIDNDAEPCDGNYYGLLADGCVSHADALACAAEHGWISVAAKPAQRAHPRAVR